MLTMRLGAGTAARTLSIAALASETGWASNVVPHADRLLAQWWPCGCRLV